MRRRVHVLVAVLLCCGGLALVPFATGASSTADATAVIASSGTSYTLTWTATGDEALRCMGLILLPGEVATGATGPPDWTIRALPLPGDPQGRYVVHATRPPPGLAPGATLAIRFTTQGPLATNRAREIRFSSTCVVGSDVVKQSIGPTAPPPPPPPPTPRRCECESLKVGLGPDSKRNRRHHEFLLVWDMECTGGAGECSGRLEADQGPMSLASLHHSLVFKRRPSRAAHPSRMWRDAATRTQAQPLR